MTQTTADTRADLLAQIAQESRRRADAIQAEQERLARETAAQDQIDASTTRIDALQAELRVQTWQADVAVNAEYVAANERTFQPVLDILNTAIEQVKTVHGPLLAIDRTFKTQRGHANQAIDSATSGTIADRGKSDYDNALTYVNAQRSHAMQLDSALSPAFLLIQWAAGAPDDETLRLRLHLLWALVPEVNNQAPPKDYNARATIKAQWLAQFAVRH